MLLFLCRFPGFNTQPPEGGWLPCYPQFFLTANVSTHSRPKAAGSSCYARIYDKAFQHTAARRRLDQYAFPKVSFFIVSTHSRPKAAGNLIYKFILSTRVSTHSRPKAAGRLSGGDVVLSECFNTQPPEGGWAHRRMCRKTEWLVSTHSRPKAAGATPYGAYETLPVSTHSRPKAAGIAERLIQFRIEVSTHSRPKAAGSSCYARIYDKAFQHTAARRRL